MSAAEADQVVARMKRAAMDAEYLRRLRSLIPADLFSPESPAFGRTVTTSSMTVAARAGARQGYDAGRWGTVGDCPYRSRPVRP